ncbi:MAG: ATP-binding cassette domain-containing protein [Lachnospiraceae bacterium]|nr:ATP-binding cassette domain-containing protein [Lachnospiraceae bacterium]
MKNPIIIDSLTIQYGDNKVIDNFSYTIEPGRIYAVMGASGIGKTSLINAVMGLIPYTGTISCDEDLKISAVFQEDRLCEGMSASRNIRIVCDNKEQISRIPGLMSDFGLADCVSRKVRDLSGGMKRRIAIIRALISSHNLLIMDEPFKGLDEATRLAVMNSVRKETPDDTILMITHDISEAEFFNAVIINL